ncbi:MAG: MarR family transcriptional regulator [Gemmatimonadota bacterium]
MDADIFDLEHARASKRRPPTDTATGDLFAPAPPPHNGTETSKAAAKKVAPHVSAMRAQVYDAICVAGPAGVTRSDIASATGIKKDTVNARCSELLTRGLVKQVGKRDGEGLLFPTGTAA